MYCKLAQSITYGGFYMGRMNNTGSDDTFLHVGGAWLAWKRRLRWLPVLARVKKWHLAHIIALSNFGEREINLIWPRGREAVGCWWWSRFPLQNMRQGCKLRLGKSYEIGVTNEHLKHMVLALGNPSASWRFATLAASLFTWFIFLLVSWSYLLVLNNFRPDSPLARRS